MIKSDFANKFIKSVYDVISKDVGNTCYMSPDKSKVLKVWNIKHGTQEMRHVIWSKEDISLSNFLFRADVYVYDDEAEYCGFYSKWLSLVELINDNWILISNDTFREFRKKVKNKLNEYNEPDATE